MAMTVFDIAVLIVLLLMAAAIVILFAMMGSLSGQILRRDGEISTDLTARRVEKIQRGTIPSTWPSPMASLPENPMSAVLALSTTCKACSRVADDLPASSVLSEFAGRIGLLIVCRDEPDGDGFLREHHLDSESSVFLDVRGAWLNSQFGLEVTPTLAIFEGQSLLDAYAVSSAMAVLNALHIQLSADSGRASNAAA